MRAFCFGIVVVLFVTSGASAEPLEREAVPAPLAPWVDWALHGSGDSTCPALAGNASVRVCAWPSRLGLSLGHKEGQFTQRWFLDRETTVALPGDGRRWPQDVRAGGAPVPVIAVSDHPHIKLPAGEHQVSGRFLWDALPELLQVPSSTGLIELSIYGNEVPFPNRDAQGRLWLQKRNPLEGDSEQRLDVRAHRRLADEIPMRLETRIELNVSGRSREVVLGRALPEGFVPVALSSPLPARLDADGRLRVQVRPGRWNLVIDARDTQRTEAVALAEPAGDWDASEEWVFEARPDLRLVTVQNGVAVDPNQTTLPAEWREFPAYQMVPGHELQLVEERRGDSDPAPDQLSLSREIWLDFDGAGYTAKDSIDGVIRRSTRLEMASEIELGRVAIDEQDQVITRVSEGAASGVEVAQGPLRLVADSRLPRGSSLRAVGWDHDFQALDARLNLPPGWTLFHTTGVDSAASTWLSRWTLLDLFAVLVIAAAFHRLWSVAWGLLALIALGLTWTEHGAPHWIWAATLAGTALLRVVPEGRAAKAAKLYRAATLALLVLLAIPFAVSQVRAGLFPTLAQPHLDQKAFPVAPTTADFSQAPGEALEEELMVKAEVRRSREYADEYSLDRSTLRDAGLAQKRRGYEPDPNAHITTGPGLPAWSWTTVHLNWSGPVASEQELGLVLVPPFANRFLAFARVGTLAALLLCLLGAVAGGPAALLRRLGRGGVTAALVLLAASVAPSARADIPSQEMLETLRKRLLEAPACSPNCAASPRLSLEISPLALRARIEIDAMAETAVPLPGGARSWSPTSVSIDGEPAAALLRRPDGTLWLRVEPGHHQVVAEGALPARDSVDLSLPLRPRHVSVQAEGWSVNGVHEDGVAEANLQLARDRGTDDSVDAKLEPGALPSFLQVVRDIELGLEWRVRTSVVRVSPADTAIVVEIPLLPGESLVTEGVRAENGRALVSMAPGHRQVTWDSILEQDTSLSLAAISDAGVAEVWRLDTSPVWHVSSEGIPPVHASSPQGARTRQWRPWPGESLQLHIDRPAGVPGATVTIDRSELTLTPGLRATDASLAVALRSSRGGPHTITLPEGAELQQVTSDGTVQPVRQEGRAVRIALRPGRQELQIQWREPRGGDRMLYRAAGVDLGIESVNSAVNIIPLHGRWTLFAGGPRLGPAVLFWPLLAVFAAIAFALGRFCAGGDWAPLRARHWFLLSIGLSQVPVPLAAFVVAWLLALGWRKKQGTEVPGQWFNLMQLVVALASAIALLILFFAIQQGLLGQPEMQVAGNGSHSGNLRWYQDRVASSLPQPWVSSAPLLIYRVTMLAWALWLALMLMRWLRWGWECFSAGELWRPRPPRVEPNLNPTHQPNREEKLD